MVVVLLFFTVPWVCLQFVIVESPDNTHLIFLCLVIVLLNVELSVVSSLAIILMEKREKESWLLYFNCLPDFL